MSLAETTTVNPNRKRYRACLECGDALFTLHGDFCCDAHRKAWNNRRLIRGAEFYDLFMCLRWDRAVASKLKVWTLICRLASRYRAEDRAERDGRPSWKPPQVIRERHVPDSAVVVPQWRRRK